MQEFCYSATEFKAGVVVEHLASEGLEAVVCQDLDASVAADYVTSCVTGSKVRGVRT